MVAFGVASTLLLGSAIPPDVHLGIKDAIDDLGEGCLREKPRIAFAAAAAASYYSNPGTPGRPR
jgi:hypothetical protein